MRELAQPVVHAVTNSHAGSVLTYVAPVGFFGLIVLWGFFNRRRAAPPSGSTNLPAQH